MAHKETSVCCAAINGVMLLVQDKSLFEIDQETYMTVVDRICWSISEHISRDGKHFQRDVAVVGTKIIMKNCIDVFLIG